MVKFAPLIYRLAWAAPQWFRGDLRLWGVGSQDDLVDCDDVVCPIRLAKLEGRLAGNIELVPSYERLAIAADAEGAGSSNDEGDSGGGEPHRGDKWVWVSAGGRAEMDGEGPRVVNLLCYEAHVREISR